jgi:quercetin dioxygenase-like cupin family protein
MMRRIAVDNLPIIEPTEGVRYQSACCDGRQIRVVEFAPGFREADWCSKLHVGYVLSGQMEVEFANGIEVFSIGDALMIAAGDVHRVRVMDGPVRLFLVEETEEGTAMEPYNP